MHGFPSGRPWTNLCVCLTSPRVNSPSKFPLKLSVPYRLLLLSGWQPLIFLFYHSLYPPYPLLVLFVGPQCPDAASPGLFTYGLWDQNSIGCHFLNPTKSINSALRSWVVSHHLMSPWRQWSARHHTGSITAYSSASVCLRGAPQVPLQFFLLSASSACTSSLKRRSEQSEGARSTPSTSSWTFAQTATHSTITNSIRSAVRGTRPLMMPERRPSLRNSCLWRKRWTDSSARRLPRRLYDQRVHCQWDYWVDAVGPQRPWGAAACNHDGVLHGHWGRLRGAAGQSRAILLPGCHQELVAVVSENW